MWPTGCNLLMLWIRLYVVSFYLVRNRVSAFLFLLSKPLLKLVIHDVFFYLICESAWMTSWMTSEFYSYVNLEVPYKSIRFPTSIWSLFNVRTFLHYWYTCQVKMCLWCWTHVFFCPNLYRIIKTEICINNLLSSILDIQEQENDIQDKLPVTTYFSSIVLYGITIQ